MLGLTPSPSGRVFRLTTIRPARVITAQHFPLHLEFSGRKIRTTGLRFGNKARETVWINVDRAKLDGLETAVGLVVEGDRMDLHFPLPGIQAVLKALDKCSEDLRDFWNMAEGAVASPATPVKPLHQLFSTSDYPGQALAERLGGATIVIMLVDETGVLKDCMLEQASGIATLDAMGCLVLHERAKFRPALDREGKAVRSILTIPIKWRTN